MCKTCEAEGGKCRLKKNDSREPLTHCVKGTTTLHILPLIIFHAITNVVLTFLHNHFFKFPIIFFNLGKEMKYKKHQFFVLIL